MLIRFSKLNLSLFVFGLLLGTQRLQAASATEIDAWTNLKTGNYVALMRHAIAPGNGDPTEFTLGDCDTQRNLSSTGREQAQSIGATMKSHGIASANVFTSQWCRCIDTATELGVGPFQELPFLNSFYQDRSTSEQQTAQLREWIFGRLNAVEQKHQPAVLVTHQVNITALTGVFPTSGEVVFLTLKNGALDVVTSVVIEP